MEARHQIRVVRRASQVITKRRRDEAAQDSTREWEVVQGRVTGRWREATPRVARGRGRESANVAAPNLAPVGQPQGQLDLVAPVVDSNSSYKRKKGKF